MRTTLLTIQNQTHIAMKAQWTDRGEKNEVNIPAYHEKNLYMETSDPPLLRIDPLPIPREKPRRSRTAGQDRDTKFADCAEQLWEILAKDADLQDMMHDFIDSDDPEAPDEEDLEAFEGGMKLRIARFMYDYEEQKKAGKNAWRSHC